MYYDSDDNEFKEFDGDSFDDDNYYIQNPSNKMVKIIKEESQEMQYLSEFPSPYGRYIAFDC